MAQRRLARLSATLVAVSTVGILGVLPAGSTVDTAKRETPEQFLKKLGAAIRKGNDAFLLSRLNAAVIERYGEPLCEGFVLTLEDPTSKFVVKDVGPPEDYDYASDDLSTIVPKTRTITVERTTDGTASTQTIHLAPRGRKLTWFSQCKPTGADAVATALGPYTGTYTGTWEDTRFDVGGDITIEVVIDADAHTLNLSLTFTGQLFGAPAPGTEQLPAVSLEISEFGAPVAGSSTIFGPYTVTYSATGTVRIDMPQCPPGSCTLEGTLTPGAFSGTVHVDLNDGSTSQGTIELSKD